MVNRKTIQEIFILLSISAALTMIVNFLSPSGIPLIGQWDTSKGVITANAKGNENFKLEEIHQVKLAKEIHAKGHALFIDARSRENYDDGHIPGAVSFPVGQFDERIDSFITKHAPEQPIVTYCSGRICEDSHNLAQLLSDVGYTHLKVFIDGFPGWKAQGYPVE